MNTEHLQQELARRGEELERMRRTIASLPGDLDCCAFLGGGSVWLSIPYSPARFKAVRQALGPKWRREDNILRTLTGVRDLVYYRVGAERDEFSPLYVSLSPTADGATCRRVQVGERVMPVYEVVCDG